MSSSSAEQEYCSSLLPSSAKDDDFDDRDFDDVRDEDEDAIFANEFLVEYVFERVYK